MTRWLRRATRSRAAGAPPDANALYQRPRTSQPHPAHRIYPTCCAICRSGVGTDVPLRRGFLSGRRETGRAARCCPGACGCELLLEALLERYGDLQERVDRGAAQPRVTARRRHRVSPVNGMFLSLAFSTVFRHRDRMALPAVHDRGPDGAALRRHLHPAQSDRPLRRVASCFLSASMVPRADGVRNEDRGAAQPRVTGERTG